MIHIGIYKPGQEDTAKDYTLLQLMSNDEDTVVIV